MLHGGREVHDPTASPVNSATQLNWATFGKLNSRLLLHHLCTLLSLSLAFPFVVCSCTFSLQLFYSVIYFRLSAHCQLQLRASFVGRRHIKVKIKSETDKFCVRVDDKASFFPFALFRYLYFLRVSLLQWRRPQSRADCFELSPKHRQLSSCLLFIRLLSCLSVTLMLFLCLCSAKEKIRQPSEVDRRQ